MKAKRAINKTKRTLEQYGCSFKEYMRDSGRRDDIDLGEKVNTNIGIGVVVGWNQSCNYNIYIPAKDEIYNMHPSSVEKTAV